MVDKNEVILRGIIEAVIEEMQKNDDFKEKINSIIMDENSCNQKNKIKNRVKGDRPSNRRDPAVLNPIVVIVDGEDALRDKLSELSEKELKDIVADYGMDSSKLAMKWKNKERLIDFIITVSRRRATKGDAFRG